MGRPGAASPPFPTFPRKGGRGSASGRRRPCDISSENTSHPRRRQVVGELALDALGVGAQAVGDAGRHVAGIDLVGARRAGRRRSRPRRTPGCIFGTFTPAVMSVSTAPGSTPITWVPCAFSSARTRLGAGSTTPPWTRTATPSSGKFTCDRIDSMLTIAPPPFAFRIGWKARHIASVPK